MMMIVVEFQTNYHRISCDKVVEFPTTRSTNFSRTCLSQNLQGVKSKIRWLCKMTNFFCNIQYFSSLQSDTIILYVRCRRILSSNFGLKWNCASVGYKKKLRSLAPLKWTKLWVLPKSINTVTFLFFIYPSILRFWGVIILPNSWHDMARLNLFYFLILRWFLFFCFFLFTIYME